MQYASAWQNKEHSQQFGKAIRKKNVIDFVSKYNRYIPARCLNYLINSAKVAKPSILDVGCAGGDVYAYLSRVGASASWEYKGVDISAPAISLAQKNYGEDLFQLIGADDRLENESADIVVSIDVLIHHLSPFEHLATLINCTKKYLLIGIRTRESGATVLDPEFSCQRNYGEWVPFLVFNLDELYTKIFELSGQPIKMTCFKDYQILAGKSRRFLPKELYSQEAKTAVTTLLIEKCDKPSDGHIEEYIIDKTKGKYKKPIGYDLLTLLYQKKYFANYILRNFTEKIKSIDDLLKYSEVIDTKVMNYHHDQNLIK